MTKNEMKMFEEVPSHHSKYWVPCQWFSTLLHAARQEGRIVDDYGFNKIYEEMIHFKSGLGMLFSFDWISIPLVYTQVATISVYVFFLASLITRQFIDGEIMKEITGQSSKEKAYFLDLYVPGFTIFQLFFYLGWLKVAESMINPFGDDDDDFDVNFILDRNFQVGMLCVDHMYGEYPTLEKDAFFEENEPQLPYTRASQRYFHEETWMGSMAHINFPSTMPFVPMPRCSEHSRPPNLSVNEESEQQNEGNIFGSGSTFIDTRKGRLSWNAFGNVNDLEVLKSAPQITSRSLLDLKKCSSGSPSIHKSVPQVSFSSQMRLSPHQIIEEEKIKKNKRNNPSKRFCRPPESDGATECLVEAWIQDENNAFPSKEALNSPLSNSTGHLANSGNGNANLEISSTQDNAPALEINQKESPTNPSNTNSLCDLRELLNDENPNYPVGSQLNSPTVCIQIEKELELPIEQKRVVFEADIKLSEPYHEVPTETTISSNETTIDSTVEFIQNNIPKPNRQLPSDYLIDNNFCQKCSHDSSGGSVSGASMGDSVKAVVSMDGRCSKHVPSDEQKSWSPRRQSYQIAQETY